MNQEQAFTRENGKKPRREQKQLKIVGWVGGDSKSLKSLPPRRSVL
jgi:hypothetical protein